jgi:hypothetical protein
MSDYRRNVVRHVGILMGMLVLRAVRLGQACYLDEVGVYSITPKISSGYQVRKGE